ncbi:MAG: glucose-6-phosphate dehydrogenase assembly protein OpcA [Candidatus Limnocylindria bacterium]
MTGGNGKNPWTPSSAPTGSDSDARRERAQHRHLMRFGQTETVIMPMWEARGTSVLEIEAQLGRIWQTRAGDVDGDRVTEKGRSHARASVLNLIVTAPDAEAADRIAATMMSLGARHPSRAIVLVANPLDRGDSIDASITVHCHRGPSQAEQICHETVMLTVRGEAAVHLSGVVAPLLIHDLPTHVWWPGDPPFEDPIFDQLVAIGDRLIVDSSDFTELLPGYRRLTNLRRQTGVGDLAWERLAWWHEVTAEFFDTPRFRRYLANLNRLIIRYAVPPAGRAGPEFEGEVAPGVSSPLSQALLYAGWLASRLEWRRYRTAEPLADGRLRLTLESRYELVDMRIEPVETDAYHEGDLVYASLRALGEAGAAEFIVDRAPGDAKLATNADGMTAALRTISCESKTEAELLSQQLIIDRHDRVFEAALRAAAVFLAAARHETEAVA